MSKGLERLKNKNLPCANCKELKALEIIKNKGILEPYKTSGGQCWLETMCDATKIATEEYELLKEVLL